jgi:hypothetical protein
MPANQRLRTDDVERLQDRRKHAIELDEEPSVGVAQPNSAAALPLQDNHLLAEHRNLGVKARLRCERPDQDCENEPEKPDHPVSLRDSLCPSTERGFRYTQNTISKKLIRGRGDERNGYLSERLHSDCELRPAAL